MSKGDLIAIPKGEDSFSIETEIDKPKTIMGRPTDYTDTLAAEIIWQVMEGKSTRKICEQDGMPSRDTLYRWLANSPDFSDQYVRACKIRREDKFERIEDIADTEDDVARARLKVDVIKWQLSKEEPKKYGDKIDMTSDGEKLGVTIDATQAEQLIRARAARADI